MDGFTSIPFERDEFKLVVNRVPAQICPSCGDALVDEDVAIRLLSITEDMLSEGIFEIVRDYDK
jgi:YgiT-type zinc finger domain-containing protein